MVKQTFIIAGCLLTALTGCARKGPRTPATPWSDIFNDSLCFFTTTTDPNGLAVDYTYDWGDGQTSTTGRIPSGETAYSTHAFAFSGEHQIRAMARDENGRASGWSAPLMFRSSQPPKVEDTIIGPVRWAVNRWYRASVKVTDPDGDSVSVKFVWGDIPGANWTAFVPSGSVVTDSCLWNATGPHTVKVVVKDQGSMVTQPGFVKTVSLSPVAILWTNDNMDLWTSPALGLAGGQVIVCAVDASGVWGINADGTKRWKWEREPMSAHNGPSTSADGSRLYVADDNRGVICFDVSSGAMIWQLDHPHDDCTPVVGPDGLIYVAGGEVVTRIRDVGDTARVEWTFSNHHPNTNVVLGATGTIYGVNYGSWDPCTVKVFALDTTGALLWQDTTHVIDYGYFMSCPALDNRGRLVVASGEDSVVCFNPDGSLAWSSEAGYVYGGGITVGYDDRIYVQSYDYGLIYCLDSDGRMVWASQPPEGGGDFNNVCALADSSIFYVCDQEYVGRVDWNGQVLWEFSLLDSIDTGRRSGHRRDEGDDEPTPIVGPDGNIYMVYYDGICCLAAGNVRLANTAWPTYNHDNARSGWAGRH